MALRINNNVSALNSHRALSGNDAALSKSLERLSTGLRINRAADDAAGLTISERLRTQIRGLNRASLNIQDGISLIQTAEGALDSIQGVLQRMRELAVQAGNDTLTSNDRLEIQKEIEQLKDQVDQVAFSTEFNTKQLLDGSSTAVVSSSAPNNLEALVTGSIQNTGDYSITVRANGENAGKAQKQRSNIFIKTNGSIAGATTTLQSIRQFTNSNGFFTLSEPQELYMIADNKQHHFTVSKDLTVAQLASRISIGMNSGLGISGSTLKVSSSTDTVPGTLETTAGRIGEIGNINFTGSEDLIKSLGFAKIVEAEDAVYTIKSTRLDQSTATTTSFKISGNRASNMIAGVDLQFIPGLSASISSSIKAQHGISIDSATNLEFHVTDTDGTSIGIVLYNNTATTTLNGTTITLPAGASKGRYSAGEVVSFFNQAASGNYTDNTASIHHFLATRGPSTLNTSVAFGAAGTASFHFGMGRLSLTIGSGAVQTQVSLFQHFESTASVAAAINSSLVFAGVLVSVATNGNNLRFYQKAGATGISIINIAGPAQNDGVADFNNLRKLGFSFAAANITSASSFVQTSFALQSYDFSSIAGVGNKGPLSFAVSQTGTPTNIVIRENVGSIGGLVSTINTQLIAGNSGVRASQVGGVLQFYTANGPELFQIQDLGLPVTGLFDSGFVGALADTRNLRKIHLADATNHTSVPPSISKTPKGGDANYSVRAALTAEGNISFYYLSEKGSSSTLTVSVRAGGAANKLGLNNGVTSGTGGVQAITTATTAVPTVQFGNGVTAGSIVLFVSDQEFDSANKDGHARLSFSGNATYATSVIKNVFNQQLAQQDSKIRASITTGGALQFYTQGGGAVSKVTVREFTTFERNGVAATAGQDVSLAQLGFTVTNAIPTTGFLSSVAVNHITATGTDGTSSTGANFKSTITTANRIYGYNIGDFNTGAGDGLKLKISDGTTTSGTISINEGELSFGTAFYKATELVSIFETTLNATNIKVTASYDSSERKFILKSDDIGSNAKIQILETSPGSNTLNGVIGIAPDSYSGTGATDFKLHIKDTSVKFQIGANEKQEMNSNISRMDTIALGISKVDLTNRDTATRALTSIDRALDAVSSERAKLGAIQNRMEFTKTSVDVAAENLTASESRIRDVDFAKEVIAQTRSQILLQSSTAQLAQANSTGQVVLQLLGG